MNRSLLSRFLSVPILTILLFALQPALSQTATPATSGVIQAVLDSVDINEIYSNLRQFSGEEAYLINGNLDSIMTRYSYSPDIYKAQDYLLMRLQEMGYTPELQAFTMSTFYDVKFAPNNPDVAWVSSEGEIYGTTDGGTTWTTQFSSGSTTFWSLFALNDQTAFAVGESGRILKLSGGTWQQLASPTGSFLFGVYFYDANLGWICGDGGLIMKTSDGGATWSLKSTPTSSRLYDIYFTDDTHGWAVGRSGSVLYSSDGGDTWSSQSAGTSTRLYGVHFLDNQNGWLVGWDGVIRKTSNGGQSWSTVSIGSTDDLYDLDFTDALHGLIVGTNGAAWQTSDGGATWTAAANIYHQHVYGCDLLSANHAWATGTGVVVQTLDGGASWQSELGNLPQTSLNNVIATKTGTTYPDQQYIICAHYDDTSQMPTVRAPGADDNGSGSVTVLEAARVLSQYEFEHTVKFVWFAGEEQGLNGSAAYAANAAANGDQILGVINLDMIGYDANMDGVLEIHAGNMGSSQAIGTAMMSNISAWGLNLTGQYLTYNSTTASDHASFWNFGFPAILQIEDFQDFTPFYHSTNDRITTLNQLYFQENARLAIASLAQFAVVDSTVTGLDSEPGQHPEIFTLFAPYPNPFNPRVNIEYHLTDPQHVRVAVYDILGQVVQDLQDGMQYGGRHHLVWAGTDQHGNPAATGLYFVRVQAGKQVLTRKIILAR